MVYDTVTEIMTNMDRQTESQ